MKIKYLYAILFIGILYPRVTFSQENTKEYDLSYNGESETPMIFTVEKWSDLSFGYVYGGTTAEVDVDNPNAALFRLFSDKKGYFTLTFTLPATLNLPGGGTVPITFDQNHAYYTYNNSTPISGTYFDPTQATTILINIMNTYVYIWLGGTINIPSGTPTGNYTATITFTVQK